MSKVVHLSDEAHHRAKDFCREHSMKMSDWVAALIHLAVRGDDLGIALAQNNVRTLVQKKKHLEFIGGATQATDDDLAVYAAPPFWAQAEH